MSVHAASPTQPNGSYRPAGSLAITHGVSISLLNRGFVVEVTTASGTNYQLTSHTKTDATAWARALAWCLAAQGGKGIAGQDACSGSQLVRRGTLVKKGATRCLLLKGSILAWYTAWDESVPRGMVMLQSIRSVRPGGDREGLTFLITLESAREYEWRAASAADAAAWVSDLRAACKATQSAVRSSATSAAGAQAQPQSFDNDGGDALPPSSSKTAASAPFLLSAWVVKKSKRRFLLLRNNTLLWFEKETGTDEPGNAKNSMLLAGCSVRMDSSTASDGRTVIVTKPPGHKGGPSSTPYSFTFGDVAQALTWTSALQSAIARAASLRDVSGVDGDRVVVRRGPLRYQGRDVQGVLTERQLDLLDGEGKPVLSVTLQDARVDAVPDDMHSFALCLSTGKRLVCTVAGADGRAAWMDTIAVVIDRANATLQPTRVFGVPLARALATSSPTLPSLCLAWLGRHAMAVPGLFRESGDSVTIGRWRDMANRGVPLALPANADPHAVAGLLKLFLRQLPDPLIPYKAFSACLDTDFDDARAASRFLSTLPAPHRIVLVQLLTFLHTFSHGAARTNMGARQLALSFGTTLLRPPPLSLSPLEELQSAAACVDATQNLILHVGSEGERVRTDEGRVSRLDFGEDLLAALRQPQVNTMRTRANTGPVQVQQRSRAATAASPDDDLPPVTGPPAGRSISLGPLFRLPASALASDEAALLTALREREQVHGDAEAGALYTALVAP